jgi:competence protein ComEC
MRDFFKRWLPGRSFDEICLLSPLDRAGHMLAFFCRETLALNLAIHLVSLPLIFFHFHKFPLLSLVYNLFLPPAVSLAYLFLIPGLLLTPFLKVAEFLTGAMLDVATNPPALFDFEWRVSGFTLSWTLLTLTLILGLFYERGRLLNSAWRR